MPKSHNDSVNVFSLLREELGYDYTTYVCMVIIATPPPLRGLPSLKVTKPKLPLLLPFLRHGCRNHLTGCIQRPLHAQVLANTSPRGTARANAGFLCTNFEPEPVDVVTGLLFFGRSTSRSVAAGLGLRLLRELFRQASFVLFERILVAVMEPCQ